MGESSSLFQLKIINAKRKINYKCKMRNSKCGMDNHQSLIIFNIDFFHIQ